MLERWWPGAWWKLPRGTCPLPAHPSRQLPPSPLAVSLCCSRVAACPLPAHSPLLLGHSSLPFARLQTLKTLKTLKTLQLPRDSFHLQLLHCFLAAAATKPSGRQPLLFQGCSVQAKGRLQPWNSKGWRPEGLVAAAARDVQAKGRLQPWNSKGWRPEGLVAAAARKQCSSWRWKLSRGSWRVLRVLRVLSVWSLANGRLECPNKRGLCAGKGQAAMLERWRPRAWWKLPRGMCRKRAGCKPGTAKADGQRAWWKLPRGSWRVLRVLRVLSKRQAWMPEQERATCPLPAHPSRQLPPSSWPSAFQHCSLPFACT